MHSSTDNAGFLPLLIALAKEKGAMGYPGDGSNRWSAAHARDLGEALCRQQQQPKQRAEGQPQRIGRLPEEADLILRQDAVANAFGSPNASVIWSITRLVGGRFSRAGGRSAVMPLMTSALGQVRAG